MPQSKSRAVLVGADLVAALAKTAAQVKWVRKAPDGLPEVVLIAPSMAVPIVRAGNFEGKTNHGHVVLIRERKKLDTRRFEIDPSFWADRRGASFFRRTAFASRRVLHEPPGWQALVGTSKGLSQRLPVLRRVI